MPEAPSTSSSERGSLAEADTLYAPSAAALQAGAAPPRRPMGRARRFVLLTLAGLSTIVVVVVAAIALRPPSTITSLEEGSSIDEAAPLDAGALDAAPVASALAIPEVKATPLSADALDEARGKGVTALAALAEKYPDDPALLEALLVAYAREKPTYAKAMSTARRLFSVAPDKAKDPDVERVMTMVANGPVDVATTAMEIMSTSMGSRGPELLYELILAPSVGKYPKERASRLLADASVKKLATPALVVANDLRVLSGCDRRKLFSRAATDGDERSLALLRPLLATKGCAWHRQADCYTCLGDRADLKATIEAIEKRLNKSP